MFPDQNDFILLDTEFTSWEGSLERKWSGEGEHREFLEIGAIKVIAETLTETDSYHTYVKPVINPVLSAYVSDLTGITEDIIRMKGRDFIEVLHEFHAWCGDQNIYSFGRDGEVMKENCDLNNVECPFRDGQFVNLKPLLKERGIPVEQYHSGILTRAFGVEPTRRDHGAIEDARTVLDALVLFRGQRKHARSSLSALGG